MDDRSSGQSPGLEALAKKAQHLLQLLVFCFVITFMLGATLMAFYFLRHKFTPGGLSASDTVSFALLSFGYFAVLGIGLGVGTLAGFPVARFGHYLLAKAFAQLAKTLGRRPLPLSPFARGIVQGAPRRLEWRPRQVGMLVLGTLVLIVYVLAMLELPIAVTFFLFNVLLTGVLISTVVFGDWVDRDFPARTTSSTHPIDAWMNAQPARRRNLMTAGIVALVISFFNIAYWQDASLLAIGFREQDVSVRLAREDFDAVAERATRIGIVLNPCESITPTTTALHHADILWQNLGTRTLLRFPSHPIGSDPPSGQQILLKLHSPPAGVATGDGLPTCREFASDALFARSGQRIQPEMAARVVKELRVLAHLAPDWRVKVVAHSSDSAPNEMLSLKQAEAVKSLLQANFRIDPSRIEVRGEGALMPKLDCSARMASAKPICDRMNRRVEISWYFAG